MRFIHAADIHLDSPLRGLAAYPDAPADRLRTATRDALENLVTAAIAESVNFVVIAGDLYDGNWRDFNTGLFFIRQMGRLRQADIPVYLLYGNHDAESEMTRNLQLPDNVHAFSARKAETFRIDALRVALHGQSFKVAATTDNLVPAYPPPVTGWLNIGVLHTALEGNAAHANYAPCSLAELRAKGYQYWALGHVHTPWMERGDPTIAYPGNLQGRHIRETGAHGALLVSAQEGEITQVDRLEVDVLRWHELLVDISEAAGLSAAVRLAGQALHDLLQHEPTGMPVAVRMVFTGTSAAHAALLINESQLRHEVIAQAVALDPDRIWIEKVLVSSQPLTAPSNPSASGDAEAASALAELRDLAHTALQHADFADVLQTDWQAVLHKLPHEVLQAAPELQALRDESEQQIAPRVNQALALLLARMGDAGNPPTD